MRGGPSPPGVRTAFPVWRAGMRAPRRRRGASRLARGIGRARRSRSCPSVGLARAAAAAPGAQSVGDHARFTPVRGDLCRLSVTERDEGCKTGPLKRLGRGLQRPRVHRWSPPAQPAKTSPPMVPVTVISTPAAAARGHAVAAEDEHGGRRAHTRAERQLAEGDDRDQHGDRVEERRVDADGMQQHPVAEDLREDRDEHEARRRVRRRAGCAARPGRATARALALRPGAAAPRWRCRSPRRRRAAATTAGRAGRPA